MKRIIYILICITCCMFAFGDASAFAQGYHQTSSQTYHPTTSQVRSGNDGYDVFVPIAKYIGQGNVENLSAWFADNLEISIISSSNNSSKTQAKQILKSFFDSYSPRSFEITHTASRPKMKYAMGTLSAGGEMFTVTVFVNYSEDSYKIQQLKIERIQ